MQTPFINIAPGPAGPPHKPRLQRLPVSGYRCEMAARRAAKRSRRRIWLKAFLLSAAIHSAIAYIIIRYL